MMTVRDKSTIEKWEYIIYHLLGAPIIIYLMICVFEIYIKDYSKLQNIFLLVNCLIGVSVPGIIIFLKKRRSYLGVIWDLIIGAGIYCAIAYRAYVTYCVEIMICVFVLYNSINITFIYCREHPSRIKKSVIKKFRILESLKGLRFSIALCSLIIIAIVLYLNGIFSENNKIKKEYEVEILYGNEYGLRANIDTISKIRSPESWKEAVDAGEAHEILQAIIDCEIRYLGINHSIALEITEDMGDSLRGCYDDKNHLITLNGNYIYDNESILRTLLHEIYHSYTHCLIDIYDNLTPQQRNLYVFRVVREYAEEYQNYETEDYIKYISQRCEIDCNAYADKVTQIYFIEIDTILAERDKKEGK